MPTIAETTHTDTRNSDITINLAKSPDQFAMNSENVETGQFTFVTNSAGTAPGEPLRFNVFPNETAYSEARLGNMIDWNDVSVTYEDTDFVIRNCMYIRFWDYDGTLAYKYNIDEFLTLDEMPPLPVHKDKNLVCDGWNWTYDEILAYLKDSPSDIDVGTTASSLGSPNTADAKVIFMNHIGVTVAEMTAAEFISNGMPPLPNLGSWNRVADSWNWTQAEIEQQLAEVGGEIYVGCVAYPYTNVGLSDTRVRFWDYDGTLVYECTGAYFISNHHIPVAPDHSFDSIPLANCGWNWSANEIISHLQTLDTDVNVGAVYHTKDSHTHIIAKPTLAYPTAKIYLKPGIANDVTVDWGDGSSDTWASTSASVKTHTYNNISDGDTFDITIRSSSGTYTFTANLASNTSEAKNCKYTAIFLGENARLQNMTNLFSNNYDLETFVFWDEAGVNANVTTLGGQIFQYDYHLKCAILPKGVTTYGTNMFDSCYSLETVCMPPDAKNYKNNMFYNCYSLVHITIPEGVVSLGNYCFYNCESVPDTLVPVTVRDFGSRCFYGCRSLTYMELGKGTNTVGSYCFYGCTRITPAIIIPHDTDMSGNESYLFYGCVSLNHISLPFSYKFKESDTYFMYNCMSADGVTIPYGSTAVPAYSFRMCCHLGRTVIPYGVTDIGSGAFANSVADRIEMPATVKSILGTAVQNATMQNHITIPRNVTQLEGTYTFASAYGLTSISLPPGITVYGNYTANDTLIPRLTLSDAITAIPTGMFAGNAGRICTLTIPKNVSSIANSAVSASLLIRTYCMSKTPPTLGTSNFGGMASYGKIYVPSGYGATYKSASNWSSSTISSRIVEYNPSLISGTLSYTEPKPKNAAVDTEPSYEIHKTANTKNIHMLFGPESGIYGEDNLNVRFYNWDGSLLYAFPGDYFSQNSPLPDLPDNSDENLKTHQWNWTANAISAVLNDDPYAHIDVGVECITKDGLTHIIFEPTTGAMTAKIALKPDVANSVTVDWGDGHTDTWSSTTNTVKTHTYEEIPATGSYDITIYADNYYSFTTYITGSTTDNGACRYTDIRMSEHVKAYGGNTFRGCKYLKTIILGTAEVSGANILQYAFAECASLRYIAIPSTMNYLGSYAFAGDCSLETVSLPCNLENIGTYAFQSCISLKHVTINEEKPSTYQNMFIYCHNLEHVYISPNATSVGNYAFNGCVSLKKLKIPSGVTSIGNNAMETCSSLKEIFIPKNVESIGQYAFQNSCSLKTVEFENNSYLTTIGQNAFNRCANLTEINIPDTVTSMGTNCFGDCRKLETVHLPDNSSFTSIPNNTFIGCRRLEEITVPGKITSIGNNAFQNCNSLNAVTFYSNTISFGNNCFQQCYALKYLNGATSISDVGIYCFSDCWSLRSIDISEIKDVPNYCFYCCYSLLDITFGKPRTIGTYAFNNCFNLRMNEFPDTITTIGSYAFAGCHNIKSVSTEAASIGINAFAQCCSLDTISVTGITAVPNSMCSGAYAPRTAVIGKDVTSIGTNVFQNCPALREIYCYPPSPPTLAATNAIPTNSYLTIYVPRGSLSSYQSAQNWSTFASKIFDIL